MGKLTVGQKLWYVPKNGGERFLTVAKVGRVWADIEGQRGRLRLSDLMVIDGDYTCGRCVIDRDQYRAEQERSQAWEGLRIGAHHHRLPKTVTTDAIYQAAALLGIELPARSDTGETK